MTVISTSPRAADMMALNFSQTPPRMLRRLLAARVVRKFLTVSLLAPGCLASSWTMADLSASDRVGAVRMVASLGSFSRRAPRLERALAVGSRLDDLTAAVY